MVVQTKAILFLSVALICACRMIMAVGYDATVLSAFCRPMKASPADVCEFTKLGSYFNSVQQPAVDKRETEVHLSIVLPTEQVICYLTAFCHEGVQDCYGCFATALDQMKGCSGLVGGQVKLKDCEIKYDKYGQFQP